jgi:hypothetical protein
MVQQPMSFFGALSLDIRRQTTIEGGRLSAMCIAAVFTILSINGCGLLFLAASILEVVVSIVVHSNLTSSGFKVDEHGRVKVTLERERMTMDARR